MEAPKMPQNPPGRVRDLWDEYSNKQTVFTKSAWDFAVSPQRELNHRATLIQNIGDFYHVLRPYAEPIFETYASSGFDEEDFWLWIIAEELELVYGLFDRHHQTRHEQDPHRMIHSALNSSLPHSLSRYTSHYIRAPKIYGESNLIELETWGIDLYIDYYQPPGQPLETVDPQ